MVGCMLGSSPLARGTYILNAALDLALRLIPTHAGNTLKSTLCMALTRAHPRSRGEHKFNGTLDAEPRGSSPLARGTLELNICERHAVRLIPARAGNIASSLTACPSVSAHPRSRGEHEKFISG